MIHIGTFTSKRWGIVRVMRGHYERADGPTAIQLCSVHGEPIATLSVNLYMPECSADSKDLPADCFYVKTYGGHEGIAAEALASGIFIVREDIPDARSGFVTVPAWQIKSKLATEIALAEMEGGAA